MSIDEVIDISTHDLTKRSTVFPLPAKGRQDISTHDLTKRSTEHTIFHHGPEVFQLTTSRRGRHSKSIFQRLQWHFNSRPHEEVDSNLRNELIVNSISTHDLTKRSTCILRRCGRLLDISTHDLTKRSTYR